MKKLLVMVLALAMFAAPAMANVANSKHNLSGKGIIAAGTGATELCVYCHTPHAALSVNTADVPLWNIVAGADSGSTPGESTMCMTCHDGSITFADQSNPTNGAVAGAPYAVTGNYDISDGANGLTNDHPVGFTYVIAGNANFNTEAVLVAAGAKLSTSDKVECFSCHNVHDYTNAPFLIMSNASSALCVACHIK